MKVTWCCSTCANLTSWAAALVVHALYALGYSDVAHLDGGLAAWVTTGRALVRQSDVG